MSLPKIQQEHRKEPLDISVIVPVFNAEEFLTVCVESLLQQDEIRHEIILVNDGSSDRSGAITDQFALQDSRVKVVHQPNGGASAARNTGLKSAQGEYILFVDSDDWVRKDSLCELYRAALAYRADVLMGNIWFCGRDGKIGQLSKRVSEEFLHVPFTGKDGFIHLIKTSTYLPMPFKYVYRREYLNTIQILFETGIMHEDELWSPIVLCKAERVVFADIAYYGYRNNERSVMHTTHLRRRLNSLFRVADRLIAFADQFEFTGKDSVLKSWLYATVFKLYSRAFAVLPGIKDSSYVVPVYHLDRFWRDCQEIMPEAADRCRRSFRVAEAGLKKYTNWRISEWVASIAFQMNSGKQLMLIYNTADDRDLIVKIEDIPADWLVTTDRRYVQQADAVVFYLPDLYHELDDELEKLEGQIWVACYPDTVKDGSWLDDPEIKALFDLWICYNHDNEQESHPLVHICRKVDYLKSQKVIK